MELQSVRVLGYDCDDCLAQLKADCAANGHARVGQFAVVPVVWLRHECPHGRSGVLLEPVEPDHDGGVGLSDEDDDGGQEVVSEADMKSGIEDQPDFKKGRWRELFPDTIDATKGIGYPAREVGRYGSHPQHDGSDDSGEY